MPKVGNGHVLQDGQRGLIFAYTPDEKHAILTALEQAGMKEDIDREAILQRITEAARQALVRHDYVLKFPRPPASQVRKELEGLIAAIKQLQVAGFSLSDHTRSFISGDLNNSDDPAEPPIAARLGLDQALLGCIALLYPVQLTAERLLERLHPPAPEVGLPQFQQTIMPILQETLGPEAAEKVKQAREQAPPVRPPFPRQGRRRNAAAHDFVFSLCGPLLGSDGQASDAPA